MLSWSWSHLNIRAKGLTTNSSITLQCYSHVCMFGCLSVCMIVR